MKRNTVRWFAAIAAAILLIPFGMVSPGATGEAPESLYQRAENAYRNQKMPAYEEMPGIPEFDPQPSRSYRSVTSKNLQGRWVNRYREAGSDFEEVLTVVGDRARIETYRDGVQEGVWNGEGTISIEDRSDRKVCPAFRITGEDGGNLCTIYIRWVRDDAFYDGGFLRWWQRETPEDPWNQYRYDTVTMENLQGLWYSEYWDSAGLYQTLLSIEGDRGWIFETVDGTISSVWNGDGPAHIVMEEFMPDIYRPELILEKTNGAGGAAGIYITSVEEDRFYDAGLHRWYVKIKDER